MKWLFLLLIFPGSSRKTFAQNRPTFLVEYLYEQGSTPLVFNDSIKSKPVQVTLETKDSVSNRGDQIKLSVGDLNISIDFKALVYMIANADSSKQFFRFSPDEESDININMKTPDTIYFKHNLWKAVRENETEWLPLVNMTVTETNEHRQILGYDCIKFISSGLHASDEVIFWACKNLPNTLIPFIGLTSFKDGILSIEHKKDNWQITAKSIKRQ